MREILYDIFSNENRTVGWRPLSFMAAFFFSFEIDFHMIFDMEIYGAKHRNLPLKNTETSDGIEHINISFLSFPHKSWAPFRGVQKLGTNASPVRRSAAVCVRTLRRWAEGWMPWNGGPGPLKRRASRPGPLGIFVESGHRKAVRNRRLHKIAWKIAIGKSSQRLMAEESSKNSGELW